LWHPFYKKGGGTLYYSSLVQSIGNVIRVSFPFLGVLILTYVFKFAEWWRGRFQVPSAYGHAADSDWPSLASWRWLHFLTIPVVGFAGIWVLLSNEMNW